jgi:hypothetical protein
VSIGFSPSKNKDLILLSIWTFGAINLEPSIVDNFELRPDGETEKQRTGETKKQKNHYKCRSTDSVFINCRVYLQLKKKQRVANLLILHLL